MSRVLLKKLFGQDMSVTRLTVLNGLDRILSFISYYALSLMVQLEPAIGVSLAILAEMVVVHWALRRIQRRS